MVAWRAETGQLTVDERLLRTPRAQHLGFGGPQWSARCCSVRFMAGSGASRVATCASRIRTAPTGGRRIPQPIPVVERNEVGLHLARTSRARDPYFDAPDIFAGVSTTAAAPTATTRSSGCIASGWKCIRSTCSKTVLTSPISSTCTTRRSCPSSPATTSPKPISFVDFTITFEGDDNQKIEDIDSRGGSHQRRFLGIAVTKSWGMIDNRTISAITPGGRGPPPTPDSWSTSAEHRAKGHRARRNQGARIRRRSDPPIRAGHRNLGGTSATRTPPAPGDR